MHSPPAPLRPLPSRPPTGARFAACLLPVVAAAALLAGATPARAGGDGWRFPDWPSAHALRLDCDAALRRARAALAALKRQPPGAAWLDAYDRFHAEAGDTTGPASLLAAVHPDPALREAAAACDGRWATFLGSAAADPALLRTARRVPAGNPVDHRMLDVVLHDLQAAGSALDAPHRARLRQLTRRLDSLVQGYTARLRDRPASAVFTESELADVPQAAWAQATRVGRDRWRVVLDDPTLDALLSAASSPDVRRRAWLARQQQGGDENLRRLAAIVVLRHQLAVLDGESSHAARVARQGMAGSPQAVAGLLDAVAEAVAVREREDLEALRRAKVALDGRADADEVRLQPWDVAWLAERERRERFGLDDEEVRRRFPPQPAIAWALRVMERLFGLRYEREPARLWHPDAQAWAVHDADSGRRLATLLLDLHPRDGKDSHAAVWDVRNGSPTLGRQPVAVLVANLDRRGLGFGDLETLLHELGHAVHQNLSVAPRVRLAGLAVLDDFVEAPSQMLEAWAYDREALGLMREVCPDCLPLDDDLVERARGARAVLRGHVYARQVLYARYDQALHAAPARGHAVDPMALWARLEGATPLGHVPGAKVPASFAHVVDGYAGSYYGYLWSEVLAHDARTAWGGRLMDPTVGRRWREHVLAQGNQREPRALLHDFLGREPSPDAFFAFLR